MGDTKKTRYHKRQRYRSRANNCKNARVRNPNFCKKTNVDNAPQYKHNTEDSDSVNPKIRKRTNIDNAPQGKDNNNSVCRKNQADRLKEYSRKNQADILKEYTQSLIGEQYEQYLEKKRVRRPSIFVPDPVVPDVNNVNQEYYPLITDPSEEDINTHDRLMMNINTQWQNIPGELYYFKLQFIYFNKVQNMLRIFVFY